jgi:hypothetical protein
MTETTRLLEERQTPHPLSPVAPCTTMNLYCLPFGIYVQHGDREANLANLLSRYLPDLPDVVTEMIGSYIHLYPKKIQSTQFWQFDRDPYVDKRAPKIETSQVLCRHSELAICARTSLSGNPYSPPRGVRDFDGSLGGQFSPQGTWTMVPGKTPAHLVVRRNGFCDVVIRDLDKFGFNELLPILTLAFWNMDTFGRFLGHFSRGTESETFADVYQRMRTSLGTKTFPDPALCFWIKATTRSKHAR